MYGFIGSTVDMKLLIRAALHHASEIKKMKCFTKCPICTAGTLCCVLAVGEGEITSFCVVKMKNGSHMALKLTFIV